MPEPAWKLKRSTGKNIFRFPSIKSSCAKNILFEFYLEAKYCLHLEFDPRVTQYYLQPKTFEVDISAERVRSYTPDFKIHFSIGELCYTEVKPNVIAENSEYQLHRMHYNRSYNNPLGFALAHMGWPRRVSVWRRRWHVQTWW